MMRLRQRRIKLKVEDEESMSEKKEEEEEEEEEAENRKEDLENLIYCLVIARCSAAQLPCQRRRMRSAISTVPEVFLLFRFCRSAAMLSDRLEARLITAHAPTQDRKRAEVAGRRVDLCVSRRAPVRPPLCLYVCLCISMYVCFSSLRF